MVARAISANIFVFLLSGTTLVTVSELLASVALIKEIAVTNTTYPTVNIQFVLQFFDDMKDIRMDLYYRFHELGGLVLDREKNVKSLTVVYAGFY